MEKQTIGKYLCNILFIGWKNAISYASLIGIAGFLVAPAMNSQWKIKHSIFISIGLLVICFISKILVQYYSLFVKEDIKPKAIRIISGDGVYKGRKIIVFSKDTEVSKNEILTMYCESSGARQPICLLRVLDITENEIITDQYPKDIELIDHYFGEESRRKSTYISKNIDSMLLENQILDGGK